MLTAAGRTSLTSGARDGKAPTVRSVAMVGEVEAFAGTGLSPAALGTSSWRLQSDNPNANARAAVTAKA